METSTESPLTPHGIEEQLKKALHAQQATTASAGQGGTMGLKSDRCADQPNRPSLRERVHSQLYRAEKEARQVSKLEELRWLLDKNPDVARILDLLEEVR